jgi:predicted GNAT family acetyltransferase
MQLTLTRDAELFAAKAGRLLSERAERNVMATVLTQARSGRFAAAGTPLFAYALDENDEVCAAALRTPPWPLLASGFEKAGAAALLGEWLREDDELPGVSGEPELARSIASTWAQLTGGSSHLRMRMAMHALTEVTDPPRPARGHLRLANDTEQDLMIAWERAFTLEAGRGTSDEAERTIATRLSTGAQHVWENIDPVCALTLSPTIGETARIGPVYTPPEHRQHGYASSAVAELSRHALRCAATRVMLYTDLTNPTSNKIYATVGFQRFSDWEEHSFKQAS